MQPEDLKRIQPLSCENGRFYPIIEKNQTVYCRAVTAILQNWPKPQLIEWFKKNGLQSDEIANERARAGNRVHEGSVDLDEGETLKRRYYAKDEWKGLMGYCNYVQDTPHEVKAIEATVFNTRERVAGTLDRLIETDDGLEVVDLKFTAGIYDTHLIHVQVYAHLYNLMGITVKHASVLRLGSRHKRMYELKREEYNPEVYETDFMACFHLDECLNGTGPRFERELPNTLSLA